MSAASLKSSGDCVWGLGRMCRPPPPLWRTMAGANKSKDGVPPEPERGQMMTSTAKATDAGMMGALAHKLDEIGSTAVGVSSQPCAMLQVI